MADTDYLAASDGTGNAALMHITSPRTALATVIQVDTVSGVPAFFIGTWGTLGADGFITAASARDFFGHINAGTLVIDKMAPGNVDGGNTTGQVVVIKPSTPAQNTISNAIKAGSAFPAQFANFVEPGGGVWTITSGLIGQMSAGFVWYAGARTAIAAIASHTFGANLDTYVDINPSTGAVTYVTAANGAAEPAVTAASVRVAKVVTGASITLITYTNYTEPTRGNETLFNYIAFGCTWTADAAGSTLLASMTPGVVYINGRRLTVAGVTSRAFSASVDTYVDFQDNLDGTAKIIYTTAVNNAASPAIPNSLNEANNIRNAIVVSGATNIAAAASINQGQESAILPIASSVPYAVTDSLGNLICPRDQTRSIVGFRQITVPFSATSASNVLVTGLAFAINVTPAMVGRKIKIQAIPYAETTGAGAFGELRIFTGASLGALTTMIGAGQFGNTANSAPAISATAVVTPTTVGTLFIAAGIASSPAAATTIYGGVTSPAYLIAELK